MRCHVKFNLVAFCLFLVFLPLPNWYFYNIQQKETGETDTVYIGINWTKHDSFINGAELAVFEANQAGGIIKKKIQLVPKMDEAEVKAILEKKSSMLAGDSIKAPSRKVARYFANYSPKITAVIGHKYSFMAVSAASLYQQKKIVFITPTATNDILTSMGLTYTFRMMPKNSVLGDQIGNYSKAKGIKRAAIFYERTEYAFELGKIFRRYAARNSINIVIQYPILKIENTFSILKIENVFSKLPGYISEFKKIHREKAIDAVFIFTGGSLAKKIVEEFYKRNIDDALFIAGDSANNKEFWDRVKLLQGEQGKPVEASAPSMFNRNNTDPLVRNFKKKFAEMYEQEPDHLAALGYDSINIILKAIKNAGGSDPVDVANEIRYMSPCRGVTGKIAFDKNGDPVDKNYMMKNITGNGFEYRDLNGNILESFDAETARLPECSAQVMVN